MYIYLTSTSSTEFFSFNSITNFKVKLPKTLKLTPFGNFSVALLDIDLPKLQQNYSAKYITLYTSICQPSISETGLKPVLHRIYFSHFRSGKPLTFFPLKYISLNTEALDVIDLYLIDDTGRPPSFRPGQLSCTLHIKEN